MYKAHHTARAYLSFCLCIMHAIRHRHVSWFVGKCACHLYCVLGFCVEHTHTHTHMSALHSFTLFLVLPFQHRLIIISARLRIYALNAVLWFDRCSNKLGYEMRPAENVDWSGTATNQAAFSTIFSPFFFFPFFFGLFHRQLSQKTNSIASAMCTSPRLKESSVNILLCIGAPRAPTIRQTSAVPAQTLL